MDSKSCKGLNALLIHPRLDLWAGGEYIALETAKALLDKGVRVRIACENFDLEGAQRHWNMGEILGRCEWVPLPKILPRIRSIQRLSLLPFVRDRLREELVLNTQMSTYSSNGSKKTVNIAYDGDMGYFYNSNGLRGTYYQLIRGLS